MELFPGTWGHVTDQLNEFEGLGMWITPTKQASSLVPRPGNETSKRIKSIWVPALTCGFVHAKQRL